MDSVSEVLNIQNQNIEDTPYFGKDIDTSYILAMAKIKDQVKILLNSRQLFKQQETQVLGSRSLIMEKENSYDIQTIA